MKASVVGLFGGSFDPPHCGHVELVHAALRELALDEVWVMPAGIPVHRTLSGAASAQQRLDWLRRIFAGDGRVRVIDWEVVCAQPIPSIDTLRRLVREYPDMHPVLLLGADAFAGMDDWVEYPEHAALCDVAVFARSNCPAGDVAAAFRRVDPQAWRQDANGGCGRRIDVGVALPDVSATSLRDKARWGASLKTRVPEIVRREIEQAYGQGACTGSERGKQS